LGEGIIKQGHMATKAKVLPANLIRCHLNKGDKGTSSKLNMLPLQGDKALKSGLSILLTPHEFNITCAFE